MELKRPFQEGTPEFETYTDLTNAALIVRRAFVRVAGTSSVDNFKGLSQLANEILSVRENQKTIWGQHGQ